MVLNVHTLYARKCESTNLFCVKVHLCGENGKLDGWEIFPFLLDPLPDVCLTCEFSGDKDDIIWNKLKYGFVFLDAEVRCE